MSRQAEMVGFFFAPFVSSTMRVEPAWVDDSGHVTTAFTHAMFERALDEAFSCLGLGEVYRQERGCAIVTAEAHVQYRRELARGERARVTVQLIDFDDERIHLYCEIRHATELWLSAASTTGACALSRRRSWPPWPS
jgi:acyl-CoA thioester hydrolase